MNKRLESGQQVSPGKRIPHPAMTDMFGGNENGSEGGGAGAETGAERRVGEVDGESYNDGSNESNVGSVSDHPDNEEEEEEEEARKYETAMSRGSKQNGVSSWVSGLV